VAGGRWQMADGIMDIAEEHPDHICQTDNEGRFEILATTAWYWSLGSYQWSTWPMTSSQYVRDQGRTRDLEQFRYNF